MNEEWTSIARRYWAEAGLSNKIELRLGPAIATLAGLYQEGAENSFDFAFIDADKETYNVYYERCLGLVRPGGLIVLDNVLWSGAVADPAVDDHETRILRAVSQKIRDDERVNACILTVGDGVLLAQKR
jgi:caffeoyl-CoA O-methyltransferase